VINLRKLYKIGLQDRYFEVFTMPMKFTLLLTVAAASVLFSSCNTMIGFGRDMRMGGEGLEKAAHKVSGGGAAESSGADTSGAPVY
jgi:predicted small secreted protein